MAIFKPREILNIFTDLDGEKYKELGYDTIFLDIDNTIAIPDTGGCDDRAREFIYKLQDLDYKVVIFSNNTKKRVEMFIGDLKVDYTYWSLKPLPFKYWMTCSKLKTKPSRTLVLGDQLMTDILGANLSGCTGIYCKKLQDKDTPITKFNRFFENLVWRYILHEKV